MLTQLTPKALKAYLSWPSLREGLRQEALQQVCLHIPGIKLHFAECAYVHTKGYQAQAQLMQKGNHSTTNNKQTSHEVGNRDESQLQLLV